MSPHPAASSDALDLACRSTMPGGAACEARIAAQRDDARRQVQPIVPPETSERGDPPVDDRRPA
jgi:hypothetical protein